MDRLRPENCLAIGRFRRLDELSAAQSPQLEVRREQPREDQVAFRSDPAHAARLHDVEAHRLAAASRRAALARTADGQWRANARRASAAWRCFVSRPWAKPLYTGSRR